MTSSPAAVLTCLRTILLATLLLGMAGTAAELVLLGHFEDWEQWIPLVLLGAGFLVTGWNAVRPSTGGIRLMQALMVLFIAAGGLGVMLHFNGNVEFELEMYPTMSGFELFRKTMTGATPVLAPGTMLVFGLVGLAFAYRHPGMSGAAAPTVEEQE